MKRARKPSINNLFLESPIFLQIYTIYMHTHIHTHTYTHNIAISFKCSVIKTEVEAKHKDT